MEVMNRIEQISQECERLSLVAKEHEQKARAAKLERERLKAEESMLRKQARDQQLVDVATQCHQLCAESAKRTEADSAAVTSLLQTATELVEDLRKVKADLAEVGGKAPIKPDSPAPQAEA